MYGDFSKRTYKGEFWTCVYFIQSSEPPYLVKIGKSLTPRKRMANLQVGCSGILSMIWYMRAIWVGEVILQKAFEKHLAHGEWFHPSQQLKDFVRHCKANDLKVLSTQVLEEVLPRFASNPEYSTFVDSYAVMFNAEYHLQQKRETIKKMESCVCNH